MSHEMKGEQPVAMNSESIKEQPKRMNN